MTNPLHIPASIQTSLQVTPTSIPTGVLPILKNTKDGTTSLQTS